ncbi:hypothetical protein [Sphingosinicella sp.]|uniref:hypothetical protein n=1 Tax=Sphingosinicella sp. TaxID=1917971 RepID=UPI004038268E
MIARVLIAAALLGAAPALALDPPAPGQQEARIREMGRYLEAVVDPYRGVYIRGYTGRWYYARVHDGCARLTHSASLRFNPSPGGDFDRFSTLRADGWRCRVASVVESGGPPRPRRR